MTEPGYREVPSFEDAPEYEQAEDDAWAQALADYADLEDDDGW